MFSVALSVGGPRGPASRVYPRPGGSGYAASCPEVFGLSSPVDRERTSALPEFAGKLAHREG